MPDIFDQAAADPAAGDIFDQAAGTPDIFDQAAAEFTVSTGRGLVASAQRGWQQLAGLPTVVELAGAKGLGEPTLMDRRRAFVSALSDPAYTERMNLATTPEEARRLEKILGPEARLDRAMTSGQVLRESITEDAAALQRDVAALPKSEAQTRLAGATSGKEKWQAWLQDPFELTASIVLESLPASIAGALVGGAAGSVATGVGASSAVNTFTSEFLNNATQLGYDVKDPARLEAFLNHEKDFQTAFEQSAVKASVVGQVDRATAGMAGRFIEPALKQGLRQVLKASGKEAALQAAGGSSGELVGSVAAGQKPDLFDVAMEGIAEIASGPGEVIGNVRTARQQNVSSESQPSQPSTSDSRLGLVPGTGGKTAAEPATPAAALAARSDTEGPGVKGQVSGQIRAGLAALPGAEQDLQVENPPTTPSGQPDATAKSPQTITGSNVQTGTEMPVPPPAGGATPVPAPAAQPLTPEERAQPITRGDLEDLKNVLERNQMQPRPVEDAIKPQETAQRERFTQFSKRIQAGDQAALTEANSARAKGEISEDHFRALQEAADNAGQPINRLPTKADVQERADNTVLEALQEHGALGGPELESAMRQMNAGRSAADIAAEYGGEYDALANILETIHEARRSRTNNNQANLLKRAYERARLGGNAKGVDQVLAGMQTAQAEGRGATGGLPTDTNDLIARAWDEAVRHEESQGRRAEVSPAERQLERDAAFAEDSAQPGARRQAVVADQLEPGDRLKINGADLQVQRVERTADSGEVEAVQFANGDRYGTQSVEGTRVLHVDKDSWSGEGQRRHETRTQQADTDRTKAGERALARLQAQRPGLRLRLTRGGTGWDAHPSQGKPVGGVRQRLDSTIRELIEQAFSIRIHLVESADGSIVPFNGVHLPGTRDVLIARDAEKPLLAVAFHEIGETMRTTHPGLYRELVEALTPLMRDFPEYAARIRAAQKKLGRELSDFDARAELVNDFLGDMSTRPEFWDRLAAENPSVFKRTARIVLQWLDRAMEKLRGLGIMSFNRERYFADVEQARDVVHEALNRFVAAGAENVHPGSGRFSAKDEFSFDAPESVADQQARQQREAKAKAEADKLADRKAFVARGGDRLTGSDLDTTREMFGSETRQDKSGQGSLFAAGQDEQKHLDRAAKLSEQASTEWQNKKYQESRRLYRLATEARRRAAAMRLAEQGITAESTRGKNLEPHSPSSWSYQDYTTQHYDSDSGWGAEDGTATRKSYYQALLDYEADDSSEKRMVLRTWRKKGDSRWSTPTWEASIEVIKRPSFVDKLLEAFPGMSRQDAAAINKRRNPENEDPYLVAQAWARHQLTGYDEDLAQYNEIGGATSGERMAARAKIREQVDAQMTKWSEPKGNAAPVSQSGVEAREPSKALPNGGRSQSDTTEYAGSVKQFSAGGLTPVLSAKDEFAFDRAESVVDQQARQRREDETQRRKDAKTQMLERAGQRLTSDEDTRTTDMFGGIEGRTTRQDKSGQGALFSAREDKPLWRDNIQDALATWQNKGTREQLLAHLQKTRGAMDQAEWIGLDDFLKDKPSVTREQVSEFVRANRVDVQEVENGIPADLDARLTELFDKEQAETMTEAEFAEQEHLQEIAKRKETKFSLYQLPGGENYRELLLTLPEKQPLDRTKTNFTGSSTENFRISHFDEPNILAHVRFNERTDADGKRVLFIEEVQSDWHQKGRREGYKQTLTPSEKAELEVYTNADTTKLTPQQRQRGLDLWAKENGNTASVPNAPFKQTWPMLAMKRMIRYAAENGFDRIAWTTGEQQAARYDLSKQVDSVQWTDWPAAGKDHGLLTAYRGNDRVIKETMPREKLADYIGKDVAERLLAKDKDVMTGHRELSGEQLKIGGKGMRKFYDEMLPSEVNKFVKKWGGKVGQAKIGSGDAPQFIAGSNPPNGQQVEARIKEIRAEWDGPRRTAAGWQRWNVNLDRQAEMLLHNMASGNGYALAMQNSGSIELADKLGLGGEWSAEKQHSKVHSLDITPEMRAAALEGMPLFSAKEGEQPERPDAGVWAAFRSAETRLKLMRLEQERTAAMQAAQTSGDWQKVKDLNGQMDDIINAPDQKSSRVNVDVPRSKEETAALIEDTVNVLNSAQDTISNFKAKSQPIPADLTQLRNDLTARLKLLKGWADDAAELAAVGQRGESSKPAGAVTRQRQMELEAATDPQQRTWGEWWASLKRGLRYLTSPIPELPLTGEQAEKSALFRRGYRLFATENTRVKAEAAAKIERVLEPLTALGRTAEANQALRDYYKLGTRLARLRAAGETARADAVAKRMAEIEEQSLNKDPFNLFRRLVLYRDLWWRGTFLKNEQGKPITLPNDLTVDEVAAELRRITSAIEQHPNGLAIVEAAKRHYELTEELQQSILAHGEIIPEALRNPLYFPHHIIDSWSGRLDRVKPTTEEDFRRYLIAPVGSGKLIQTDYLKAMFLHTADVLAHNARVDLVEKYWKPYDISARLREEHGEAWNKPWNIPPGYRLFSPYTKLPLRMDYILSREVLADKLGVLFNDGDLRARMGDAGKVLKVKPEDLHAALVAGEKIQWALPVEIADALDGITKREKAMANPGLGHGLGLPVRKAIGFWRMTKLFAPWSWLRYEFGNLSTDAIDKVLAADPGAAKYLARAAREVWQADQPGEKTPEFKAASREGVFDTITAGEAGDLAKLPDFQEFLTPGEKRWENVKSFLARPMRGSKFREATFRYAKFLADVERLRAGQEPVYGGAFHGDLEALGETTEGQKKMLEGDELVFAKAAEISLKTYGDYNSLGVAGQWLRQYAIPFWSWQDVNFRYHANQLRNLADGLMGIRGGTPHTAALRYAGIRVVSTLLAVGIAKELWNQFGGPALGLWDDDDDLEAKLSAQDRRRGHLLLGKDKNGQAMVVYTPSALSDIAEWTGGQNMKRLFLEWMRGQITLEQFVSDYAKQLPNDVLNKLAQSVGPVGKAPYEAISGKSTFPDITDQRSIPSSERWWRLVGNLTDDRAVGWLRGVFDRDYYSQPAAEQLQQIILQIRRRDAEQWAYYETREHAADWKEARTGKRFEAGSYDAPEAMALRNFRKAIYRGDVAAAERFYGRLLEYGYTAQRLDASIRAQSPLADLNKAEQKEYLATLNERDRAQLQLAEQYYARIKALDGREKRLFPKKGGTPRPNPELLREIVEGQSRNK